MKQIFILFCFLFLMGCSQLKPFVDSRREAGQERPVGQSRPNNIAVCYNPIWSSQTDADELAEEECKKVKKKAVYTQTKWFSGYLATPATAFYTCKR